MESQHPLVEEVAECGSLDLEYLSMLNSLENGTEMKNLPKDSGLRWLAGCIEQPSVIELNVAHRIITRHSEVVVPKSLREKIMKLLHMNNSSD